MPTIQRLSIIALLTTALTVLYCPLLTAGNSNVTDSEFEKIGTDVCSIMKIAFCCDPSENEKVQAFCRDSRLKVQCPLSITKPGNVVNFTQVWNPVEGIFYRNPDIATNSEGLNVTDSEFDKVATDTCLGMNQLFCCGISKMEGKRFDMTEAFCHDPRLPELCPEFAPAPGMALPEFATLFVNLESIENIFKRHTSWNKGKNE
ncbi:hypothetical protein DdX_19117 [Ditylenchus destructor]|uniref:Uncharacterized protein n=1 Tax=Ditylenchus destructor TaxID=166010 RepID=A0AAD4QSG2_9BILA|nr:hypothetical protein DdX_19117 [Ditylenchus destructor]